MKHFSHIHSLILNENYIAEENDTCFACQEKIVSCRSFVYSCSCINPGRKGSTSIYLTWDADIYCYSFLLHRTCAELPQRIENPTNPKEFLVAFDGKGYMNYCNLCGKRMPWIYCSSDQRFCICLKCSMLQIHSLEDCQFEHAAHSQHPLVLIRRPSSFKCDICKVENNFQDMSYKCSKCPFWMHKSCGDAPTSFQFHFHHKHPLILAFSLPKVYHKFTQYCRLCNQTMNLLDWLYYCPKCRFFAHFQCARSSPISSSSEDEIRPDLVHLPPVDESSVNLLVQQFVKDMSTLNSNNNNIIFSTRDGIKHWAHDEHHLKLITMNELNDQKDAADDDEIPLLCDACAKPILTDCDDQFYGCVPCKYTLHKFCAEMPKKVQYNDKNLSAKKCSKPYDLFDCLACRVAGNGIFFDHGWSKLHIGCAALPKTIKHETHHHPLSQIYTHSYEQCKACGGKVNPYRHWCKECDIYICAGCIMSPRTVNHRWDSHPLRLIYEAGMVTDHEHEFNCEYCSDEIDTNWWFYHCSDCDLSFHPSCFKKSCHRHCADVKFGASDIFSYKLHPHSLTFVLNKKSRKCKRCGKQQLGEPVLECAPCNTIFCAFCLSS